ncbi:outer membrane lipoprotein carrier protein LolA [uncultured Cocleimonas sp.]|uniref:outer membrane lipoprotein carrier protein LolA n=1 Tax=uncultured Cocleimonas sp. TaxID=1051587 RepID=UPI002604EA54|nr:outer membrane lipoprotein carrier protein LolA [uncultured Cocleimonas sp.]
MIRPFLLMLCLMASVVSSVSLSANTPENIKALKSMMPEACNFSGEFSQSKQIKSLPVPLVSMGEFIYSCDLGLIWKTQKPIVESLVFTNQKLNFLVPEKLSVEILDGVQHDFLANLLLGLMAGNTEFIAKEFDFQISKNDTTGVELSLVPKNKMVKQAIDSVVLAKPNTKKELQISITDKNQQVTRIVSSEKQQYAMNDKLSKDAAFSERCASLSADGCKLLLNPVRITTSGQN